MKTRYEIGYNVCYCFLIRLFLRSSLTGVHFVHNNVLAAFSMQFRLKSDKICKNSDHIFVSLYHTHHVPLEMFEYAWQPCVQTASPGPGKCKCMKKHVFPYILNPYPANFFCSETVICLRCLLHIFKCNPEYFYYRSKYYEP